MLDSRRVTYEAYHLLQTTDTFFKKSAVPYAIQLLQELGFLLEVTTLKLCSSPLALTLLHHTAEVLESGGISKKYGKAEKYRRAQAILELFLYKPSELRGK